MVETDIELLLEVPVEQERRIALIDAAQRIVRLAELMPPVSLAVLEQLAFDALASMNGEPEELAFTILMCSNELWRPYFEATPYNRRLLLLPQCLKSSRSCRAITDELGLICAGCNSCSLNSFIEEAETLGYSTLVAEGTTSAIGLVEEGAVDAILGVSCLATLQKSFKQVASSAIPSLAIPLLNDGCKDTTVDNQWLLSQIKSKSDNPDREPLSVSLLKEQAEKLFNREFLTEQFDIQSSLSFTGKLAIESMLQGGKRMRPLLVLLAYSAYSKRFDLNLIEQVMLAVECFHKASLIHDDIEDRDDYRYNRKTAHHENGIPQAINLGDYLIGQGYQKLSQLPIDPTDKLQLFDLFTAMHIESTIGQGEDLAISEGKTIGDINSLLTIFRQKTGSAIHVSLLAGAIAAHAPENEQLRLKEFSELFGIAYQIRDDLTEFSGLATDQDTASFPFLKSMLIEELAIAVTSAIEWRELISEYHIDQRAQESLNAVMHQMKACLNQLESHKLRLALLNIVNRIVEQ